MKHTSKILVAILVIMTMLLSMATLVVGAADTTATTLYLKPSNNWKQSNARFAAYFFGNGEKWVSMTDSNGDGVYEVAVPAGFPNVIFCRMNPSATANGWNNKWNQTADLTVPTNGKTLYTVSANAWDGSDNQQWSSFCDTYGHSYNKETGICATCGGTDPDFCAHSETILVNTATCESAGEEYLACVACGVARSEKTPTEALGHDYVNRVCTRCDYSPYATGNYLAGSFNGWSQNANQFMTDNVGDAVGYVTLTLTAGTHQFKVVNGSDWLGSKTDITTSVSGMKVEKGDSSSAYDINLTVTDAGEYKFGFNATTKELSVEYPHTHSWSDATCTEPSKCECGETQGEALGHNFVDNVCTVCGACNHEYEQNIFYHPEMESATCTTPGVAVFECIYCDHYYTAPTEIDPEAHDWDYENYEVITPATCTVDGVQKLTCLGCGATKESEIYASHDLVENVVSETCTVDGSYSAYCKVCDYEESYVLYAEGHFNWFLTCGQTGECLECGAEFTADPHTVTPCEGGMCMNCNETIEAVGHTFANGVCSVCGAEDPDYVAPHVNTLVVGDTNKIVVSGATLNDYGLPVEWVVFYADSYAQYTFNGDNGALAFIFDANLNLVSATGKADLVAGYYWICLGNGFTGEFNVQVLKENLLWTSNDSYVTDGYNIQYNGAGNSYACVGRDVTLLAAGNNTFTVTITNNGTADSRVRIDLQGTIKVGNHMVCNVSAVGGDVWTDMEWGGSTVTVPAGESVTLVITYDGEGQYGAVKDLVIFTDAARGDDAIYSANITLSDLAFSNVSDEPVHKNALALGDNKFVVTNDLIANYIEYITFYAAEDGKYTFTASEGSNFVLFAYVDPWTEAWNYKDPYVTNNGTTDNFVSVNLKAGLYIVGVNYFYGGTVAGEYSINVSVSEYEAGGNDVVVANKVVLGDNTYALTESLYNTGFEFTTFTVENAGYYTFSGQAPLTFFIWPDYPNVAVGDIPTTAPYIWNVMADSSGFKESMTVYLEAGVYAVGFRYDFATIGDYEYTISYSETDPNGSDVPVEPEIPEDTPDTPVEPELSFFDKILKAIEEFFKSLAAFFENLLGGNKE